jgi:hypothetical protein
MRPRRASALLPLAFLVSCASEARDEAAAPPPEETAPEIVYEADLTGL